MTCALVTGQSRVSVTFWLPTHPPAPTPTSISNGGRPIAAVRMYLIEYTNLSPSITINSFLLQLSTVTKREVSCLMSAAPSVRGHVTISMCRWRPSVTDRVNRAVSVLLDSYNTTASVSLQTCVLDSSYRT